VHPVRSQSMAPTPLSFTQALGQSQSESTEQLVSSGNPPSLQSGPEPVVAPVLVPVLVPVVEALPAVPLAVPVVDAEAPVVEAAPPLVPVTAEPVLEPLTVPPIVMVLAPLAVVEPTPLVVEPAA
jgi:hypothetical protein